MSALGAVSLDGEYLGVVQGSERRFRSFATHLHTPYIVPICIVVTLSFSMFFSIYVFFFI